MVEKKNRVVSYFYDQWIWRIYNLPKRILIHHMMLDVYEDNHLCCRKKIGYHGTKIFQEGLPLSFYGSSPQNASPEMSPQQSGAFTSVDQKSGHSHRLKKESLRASANPAPLCLVP